MNSTIINFSEYRNQQTEPNLSPESSISNELVTEIQILIQRLRDSNPIKQIG